MNRFQNIKRIRLWSQVLGKSIHLVKLKCMAFKGKDIKWKEVLKRFVFQHVPIFNWIRNYTKENAICDLIAGITICLTMIPQSIAYAALANLSPQYGLNSAFMGCFLYVFFGTIREVVIGPSSLMALLTYEYTHNLNADFVVLLCFLCGVTELIMATLKLGFVVELISAPVVSGFTTATSIIIIVSQIKGLLGVRFKANGFVNIVKNLFEKASGFRFADLLLGFSCIVLLTLLKRLGDFKLRENFPHRRAIEKLLWFTAIGRNAIAVLLACSVSVLYESYGSKPPFIVTDDSFNSGWPTFKFPPMSTQIGNTTYTFPEMVKELGNGIFIIPVVSVLANVAIAKAYKSGVVDATQEMMTLAFCNLMGSCVQSMPTAGAFTRSAVISASGVRTPLAGLYSAGLTLLAIKFLGPFFHLIPRATLSAILITAVVVLIDTKLFLPLWKSSKFDCATLVCSLVSCLVLGVEVGLLVGVCFGLGRLIYFWARPQISVTTCKGEHSSYVMVTPKMGVFFPTTDHLCDQIMRAGVEEGKEKLPVVLNCSYFAGADYTAAKGFQTINKSLESLGVKLIFLNIPKTILDIWKATESKVLTCCSQEDLDQCLQDEGDQDANKLILTTS